MATFKLIDSESFESFTVKQGVYPKLAVGLTQKSTGSKFDALAYTTATGTLFVSFAKDTDKSGNPKANWTPLLHTMDFIVANYAKLVVCRCQKFDDAECTIPTKDSKGNCIYAYTLTWESANAWQTIKLPFNLR